LVPGGIRLRAGDTIEERPQRQKRHPEGDHAGVIEAQVIELPAQK
jgi:hypothetical protein